MPGAKLLPQDPTPEEMKEARQTLGLSQAQLATVLYTDARTVRAMEAAPDTSKHRKPAVRMVPLLNAYLEGYRHQDWPTD
jgi:DNA-binding transcriptional regulator YiaG